MVAAISCTAGAARTGKCAASRRPTSAARRQLRCARRERLQTCAPVSAALLATDAAVSCCALPPMAASRVRTPSSAWTPCVRTRSPGVRHSPARRRTISAARTEMAAADSWTAAAAPWASNALILRTATRVARRRLSAVRRTARRKHAQALAVSWVTAAGIRSTVRIVLRRPAPRARPAAEAGSRASAAAGNSAARCR